MASIVLYSDEFDRAIADGTLDPQAFDYRFLCEGDSWMAQGYPARPQHAGTRVSKLASLRNPQAR